MSVTLNETNYATPVLSDITSEGFVDNTKYFALHNNVLDGSYRLLGATGPAWGKTLSSSDGSLSTAFTMTITGRNVFDGQFIPGFVNLSNGSTYINPSYPNSLYSNLIPVLPGMTLTCDGTSNKNMRWRSYGFDGSYKRSTNGNVYVVPSDVYYTRALWFLGVPVNERPNVRNFCTPIALHTLHLKGDAAANVYPTAFTYKLYNGATLLYERSFTNNSVDWKFKLDRTYDVTSYTVTVTKINKANNVARLTNIFNPNELVRHEDAVVKLTDAKTMSQLFELALSDNLRIKTGEALKPTVNMSISDQSKIKLSETHLFTNSLTASDTLRVKDTSASEVNNSFNGSDSLSVDIDTQTLFTNEAKGIEALLFGIDSTVAFSNNMHNIDYITLATNEARTFLNNITSVDSLRVVDVPNAVINNSFRRTDNISVDIDAQPLFTNSLTASDTLRVKDTSASEVNNSFNGSDSLSVDIDTQTLFTNEAKGSDVLRLDTSNLVTFKNSILDTVTITLATSEARTFSNSIDATDALHIVVQGSTEVNNSFKRTDNGVIRLSEQAPLTNSFNRVDTLSIDVSSSALFKNLINYVDSNRLSLTEERTFTNMAKVVENLLLKGIGISHIDNSFTVTDDVLVVLTDQVAITNRAVCSEDLLLIAAVKAKFKNDMNRVDTLMVRIEDNPRLYNVHTRMNDSDGKIYGKVMISYMNPLLDNNFSIATSGTAHNAREDQVLDGTIDTVASLLMLYDNKLDGSYKVIGENDQVGWWSDTISLSDGTFDVDPVFSSTFSNRLFYTLSMSSSQAYGVVLVDFTVNVLSNGSVRTYNIIDNDKYTCTISDVPLAEVTSVEIIVHKVNKAGVPANISEISISSMVWYNEADLLSMDFLEELSYIDEIESLGGTSANEITVNIRNDNDQFYFNNTASIINKQLKRNRKIVPYLGVEVVPGSIEWHQLGVFWSYSWNVPIGDLYAKVVAFDTLGLLNTFDYRNRHVHIDKSIGYLIDTTLYDAQQRYYPELTWQIEPALYDIIIPYAWFLDGTYMTALDRIAQCYRLNIYCDRVGTIVASLRTDTDTHYSEWSDSTNVIDKAYPTLYTEVPNVINVQVTKVIVEHKQAISNSTLIEVVDKLTIALASSDPIVGNEVVIADVSEDITYTYEVYSWGVKLNFVGNGIISGITVDADVILTKPDVMMTTYNELSIAQNGILTTNIKHDFIQTTTHADIIANEILADIDTEIYDADVNYTGDISLTINDPIILKDSQTPVDKYRIRRHTLYWDGDLAGTAKLNT